MNNIPPADGPLLPLVDSRPLVPVFDCRVILTPGEEPGTLSGRVVNLAGLTATGQSERAILQKLVTLFKTAVKGYSDRGEPIPWIETPPQLQPGEMQRWIPVHL